MQQASSSFVCLHWMYCGYTGIPALLAKRQLTVRPRAKVTIYSLNEDVYEKSIADEWYQNEWHDLCLKVIQGHVNQCGVNISNYMS